MSGTDNHLAGLGQMAETIARDAFYQGRPGYEGMLNDVSNSLNAQMVGHSQFSASRLYPRS